MLKTLSRSLLLAGLLGSALALPAKAQVSGALVVQAVGAGSTTGGAATLPAVATKTTFLCICGEIFRWRT